jgi:hypothetical protein
LLETTPDLAIVEILIKQLDRTESALFQCPKIAFGGGFFNLALILSAHSDRDPGASDPRCVLLHEKAFYILNRLAETFWDAAGASFSQKLPRRTTVERQHRSVRRRNCSMNRALPAKNKCASDIPFMFHYQFFCRSSAPKWAAQVVVKRRDPPQIVAVP